VDVPVQELGAVREPALALGREAQQHVLEAAERALAVDRHDQALAQRRVDHRADEPLHPAVLLARRRRLDPQEAARVVVDHLAAGRRFEVAGGDRHDLAGGEVEEALGVGGVAFDGDLERVPVELEGSGRAFGGRRGGEPRGHDLVTLRRPGTAPTAQGGVSLSLTALRAAVEAA
jgi:hypothetical protein